MNVKCGFAKMRMFELCILVSLLLFIKMNNGLKAERLVYQTDVSEHCRRQVFPSVFLGPHVMEAKSQILHFSLLEEPYSCYISIRTEPGSFIVLVFQIGYSLENSICRSDESVVTVHDMVETFGGYWGPIPLYTRDKQAREKYYYTLRTTPSTEMDTPKIVEYSDSDKTAKPQKSKTVAPVHTEYTLVITNDVPLIRLSGKLVDTDKKYMPDKILGTEQHFDFDEIVEKSELGERSTIMPLMRLFYKHPSVIRDGYGTDQDDGVYNETIGFEPRYQLQYNLDGFTLDNRLMYGYRYRSTTRSNNYKLNRLLKFKKQTTKRPLFSPTVTRHTKSTYDFKHRNDLWSQIESLLRNVSQTTDEPLDRNEDNFNVLKERIADWQHNYSIYLSPNLLSLNNLDEIRRTTVQNFNSFTSISKTEVLQSTKFDPIPDEPATKLQKVNVLMKTTENNINISDDIMKHNFRQTISVSPQTVTETNIMEKSVKQTKLATENNIITSSYKINVTTIFSSLKNFSISHTEDNTTKNIEVNISKSLNTTNKRYSIVSTILPTRAMIGSLVNHGSWENIVQVAPKIAGILSDPKMITSPFRKSLKSATTKRNEKSLYVSKKSRSKRKKRSIQAIPIDIARPHYFTTGPSIVTTSEPMFHAEDMLDFVKLVELENHDFHGPVVFRDIGQVVGKKLFDLCDEMQNKAKFRYVHLLNTSRIVIAVTNFTWKSLTVIATPVRVLTKKTSRCDSFSIECQISGARVCVDKLNACDDIPNCGVYDNYDEDRLMCGMGKGVHHNVVLGAFTFVVVILTLLYIVYYWLKRCVPKVSDAFFIYTDGTGNLLHLETVMKSPLLHPDESIRKFQGYLFDDAAISYEPTRDKNMSIFKRLKKVFTRQKEDDSQLSGELNNTLLGRMFSFPQIEIHRMMRPITLERSIQTGESLEMTFVDEKQRTSAFIEKGKIEQGARMSSESLLGVYNESLFRSLEDNELSILKFFRDSRLSSTLWDEINVIPQESTAISPDDSRKISGEYELTSTVYDHGLNPTEITTMKPDDLKYKWHEIKSDTLATTSEDSSEMAGPSGLLGKRLRFDENLTMISEGEITDVVERIQEDKETANPQNATTGRDFIRFWGKKSRQKKKTSNYK